MRYYYDDEALGRVYVTPRRGMRNMSIRWADDAFRMNVPYGISADQIRDFLTSQRQGILRLRKQGFEYSDGLVIPCFRCMVTLTAQDRLPHSLLFGRDGDRLTLGVPRALGFTSHTARENISRALQTLMNDEAPKRLLPFAQEVAQRVGAQPARLEVGRGLRKLGHCTPGKVIQLSRNLMFLDEQLVTLVVCHELAHLTHMNHSAAFHALCNHYLGGREAELEQRMKQAVWPVLR